MAGDSVRFQAARFWRVQQCNSVMVRGLAILLAWVLPASRLRAEPIEFNRDVRPLLSEYCFACHGPDKNQRKADLRLDTREGLLGKIGRAHV